mmetsp:Transcript_25864/g.103353  ORF Transcript_25864/g.103353 Transcript_25864/m.103353 type:complete len:201 (-) Transcript_25864:163-765(-)
MFSSSLRYSSESQRSRRVAHVGRVRAAASSQTHSCRTGLHRVQTHGSATVGSCVPHGFLHHTRRFFGCGCCCWGRPSHEGAAASSSSSPEQDEEKEDGGRHRSAADAPGRPAVPAAAAEAEDPRRVPASYSDEHWDTKNRPNMRPCANKNCTKQREGTKRCKCKAVAYCSKECQQEDWKSHKAVCKYARKSKTSNVVDQA